ncbi:MAG: hypothetical protein GF398_04270 [Chitinivibrionales bacterium]|nr:hypothetical protein [Chitinivibrionales bacterium]
MRRLSAAFQLGRAKKGSATMLRSIAVKAGDSEWAHAARDHALKLASQFGARLYVAGIWEGEQAQRHAQEMDGENPPDLLIEAVTALVGKAEERGIVAERVYNSHGIVTGLYELSKLTDMLVIGIPDKGGPVFEDKIIRLFGTRFLSILNKAESMVEVVSRQPQDIGKVLVHQRGGVKGKSALRAGAHLAEKYQADIVLLVARREGEQQTRPDAHQAERYLQAFDIGDVQTVEAANSPNEPSEVIKTFNTQGADIVVVGDDPKGPIRELFGEHTAQEVVDRITTPVVVAR